MEAPKHNFEEATTKGQWQWQSNENPWSKSEEPKWTSYPPRENYLIERAYFEKKEAKVGGYIVNPLHKIQKNQDKPKAQRRVRRVRHSEVEGNERSERYYETEKPKTLNRVFGSLEDFTFFISRRNHETLRFAEKFENIQESKDLCALNQKTLPELVICLQEELKKVDSLEPHNDSASQFSKKFKDKRDKANQELISSFRKAFSSFDEFYGCLLKAYTMNTFLYQNLNQYLRNEDWVALDYLFPYLFCLCKAFFNLKASLISNVNLSIQSSNETENIILYRGTALDEVALSHYDIKRQRNFSWNAVTSTTTTWNVAENFMYHSADAAKKKHPVMFIIDIPISKTKLGYLEYLGLKFYSAKPQEDEVILPPGSVFELQEVSKDDNEGRTTIKVQLKSDFKLLDYRGVTMHGARQNEMIKNQKVQIVQKTQCKKVTLSQREKLLKKLRKEELLEHLKFLPGNLFVQEIEFEGYEFDLESVETLISTLSSMKGVKKIQFIACQLLDHIELSGMINKMNSSQTRNISKELGIEFLNSPSLVEKRLELVTSILKNRLKITCLSLKFPQSYFLTDDGILNLCTNGLKHLTQLTSLTINFSFCSLITNIGIQNLSQQGLKRLTQLKHLDLNFTNCYEITDSGFGELDQRLTCLTQLVSLNLNISRCFKIPACRIYNLCQRKLRNLPNLQYLNIDFWWASQITSEEIDSLTMEKFKHLTKQLDFPKSSIPTSDKISTMCINELRYLTALNSLSLSFTKCRDIDDSGIGNLGEQGLRYLSQLTSLSLDFSRCSQITDDGFSNFSKEGLKYLTQLTSLSLDFSGCYQITDNGFSNFSKEKLNYLTQLTSLHLNFTKCYRISGQGFSNLCLQISNDLKALTSLNLNFWWNHQITLEDLDITFSQKIKHLSLCPRLSELQFDWSQHDTINNIGYLPHLVYLHLDLSKWTRLTDKEIQDLCIQALKHLTVLTSLNLNFSYCSKITDKGLQSLCSQELNSLKFLTYLSLNFSNCKNITNSGFGEAMKILKLLIALTDLNLDYSGCDSITEKGIRDFCMEGLRHLVHLTKLDLNFSGCSNIKDEGIYFLCTEGICHLIALKDLNLNFSECFDITNSGIVSLSQFGLRNVSGLVILKINLSRCFRITEEGFYHLYTERVNHLKVLNDLNLIFWADTCIQLEELENFFTPKIKDLTHSFYHQKYNEIQTIPETGFRYLTHLIFLNLYFSKYNSMLKNENQNSMMEVFNHLYELTSIELNFSNYQTKAEERILNLFITGISYLTSLTSLNLNFSRCHYLTDETIPYLCSQGLNHLIALTSLNLNFEHCRNITDEGISNLSSQGIGNLTLLTTLNLNFKYCENITDEGISNLSSQGIGNLILLTTLNLNFEECRNITDEGIFNLCSQALKHLTLLTTLNLNFEHSRNITDEGISNLSSQGIGNLTLLTTLNLNFQFCDNITDEGILNLSSQGLKHLTVLTSLKLDFSCSSRQESEHSALQLWEGIKNIPHLPSLKIAWSKGCRVIQTENL